ncbi:hypothetical protein AYO20_02663 [Fonsecaea nubica]|uniref:Zn(2)-C6 fungal-type domain-containing protein n=1 Tax=Fonsecaea nubica TaxID=856822 RepID=A0A178DAE1_9EURO|nr:hypothetical protein AYO20_02663 [Fonsecaea nubica]OAL38211.1 hypothetical protein AYO20_02663 [Fonsecaea nubica]
MLQGPSAAGSSSASGSIAEKTARLPVPAIGRTPPTTSTPTPKLRSCLVCRNRKVRCDKQSPCSNCRRANIACVTPATDRPPRWARRLHQLTNKAPVLNTPATQDANPDLDKVMERVRNLELLVKELSFQLEQTHASSTTGDLSQVTSPGSSTQNRGLGHEGIQLPTTDANQNKKQSGRLVLQDASRGHYVSSAFWVRVDDELDDLEMDARGSEAYDSDSSWDDASPEGALSAQETERTPSERHAFLFRHNLAPPTPNLHELRPLPSQMLFILDTFSRNVNVFMQIVHIPILTKTISGPGGIRLTHLTPSLDALIFSISYATVASMEEDDVMTNFGAPKFELISKYRLGTEHCLAQAEFLTVPNLMLIQAFGLFLCLARRHDSPRYVWMMTGLVIRMAQYLGLQRDGLHFSHLSPFEIEMRRRIWWMLCRLDLRASEDQGTDLSIPSGSFDTKIPLNINNADIQPETKEMPAERYGVTDMSFPRMSAGAVHLMRQIVASIAGGGAANAERQSRLVSEIYQNFEQEYFQHTSEAGNIAYWVAVTVARMVMAKMTLIAFLPALFSTSTSSETTTADELLRTKLLVSAIEVAEYNHALNAEQACRNWRWLYQSHTHWHAIVYLLLETSRRPWSSTVERAWIALHSEWLIPAQALTNENLRIWIPLRKLMNKARKHRDTELQRLRGDPQAAVLLEFEDRKTPVPTSSGPFPAGSSVDAFRERWRQLVGIPADVPPRRPFPRGSNTRHVESGANENYKNPSSAELMHSGTSEISDFNTSNETTHLGYGAQADGNFNTINDRGPESSTTTNVTGASTSDQTPDRPYNAFPTGAEDWTDGRTMGPGFHAWLWADADPSVDVFSNWDVDSLDANMDLGGEVNWYAWVESAKGMEREARPPAANTQWTEIPRDP